MAADSSSIVEDWLRSVNLVQYTQSFLDNGYDDLEVCKQIGEDDLDAIGVPRDEHREKLLRAVKVLREEGGTAVYFTLEECDTCQSGDETEAGEGNDDETCPSPGVHAGSRSSGGSSVAAAAAAVVRGGGSSSTGGGSGGSAIRLDAYDMGKTTLVTYPKVQLKLILRDKLVEDNIDLAAPPYTTSDLVACGSSLTALAIRFAEELNTHFIDVLERLEELWMIARNNDLYSTMCRSPSRGVYGGSQSLHYGYPPHYLHHHPGSPRSQQPPPLPSCPPPATMSSMFTPHEDRCTSLQSHLDGGHAKYDPLAHQNYVALDGESTGTGDDKKKGGSVFGRFLRNIGLRKSNRKGTYKQHQGDLSAYEISMSDEDRMALMILVKEGKINTQTALAVVQKFEEERRMTSKGAVDDEGKENICETPSRKGAGKKKKAGKPTKSQSTFSADDPHRCNTCPTAISPGDFDHSCDHQMCRQRRVHSLGQLDIPNSRPQIDLVHKPRHERISLTRAVSCSPACTSSHKLTSHMEPPSIARFHSPSHHQLQQQLQQQHTPHHHHHHHHNINKVDALRERFTGRSVNTVPKTSSKTSLLSSGSDQSMECGSQTPFRAADPLVRQVGDATTYNSNSTVSMSSDTNSPGLGRKKSGPMLDLRLKTHRSASCSTGDDGISSENDDIENSSKRHQHLETFKGRAIHDSSRPSKVKEAVITRPPLLRQQSAPVSSSSHYAGPFLGQAKAIVDYTPGPDEEDFVPLKKGEIVNIINMAQSGVWRGIVGQRKGKFCFEHVEVIIEPDKASSNQMMSGQKGVPRSVSDLLHKIGLGDLITLFMLNGYDDLDIFSELDDHDLDTLHISDADHRARLLSAARVLVDWNEKINAHTPALTNMDSPSSKAGNSSCDSGCYAGSEGLRHQTRRRGGASGGARDGEKKSDFSEGGYGRSPSGRTPCRSCGKPKQLRKYSGPSGFSQYTPGHYPGQPHSHYAPSHISHGQSLSPYAPSHYQHPASHQYGTYSPGHFGYHCSGGYNLYGTAGHHHYTMSGSRTLTELNASDNASGTVHLETFGGRKLSGTASSPGYGDEQSLDNPSHAGNGEKGSVGERVSLTEEDQEVIAITYGTNQSRKLSTPIQSLSRGSSQLEITNSMICNACVPSSECPQCDGSLLCDSASCLQCAAYASCPQCFSYRHYVNTTMRSDSKSSKMSCSSTCTQTTCLSPDHDESSHSGGSNLIDYTTSPQGVYYISKFSTGRTQHYYSCYQQPYGHPIYGQTPSIPGDSTPSQLPSPAPAPANLSNTPPLTLALADPNSVQGLALTLQPDAQQAGAPPTDWNSQSDGSEAPSIASLYTRGSHTPDKTEKGSANQVKSPTRSLMPLVSTKLSAERIDLTQAPYSNTIGHCGIPPLLVQRYAEELRQDLETMALVLEQLREKQLRSQGRPCIQNESLSDSCKNACDLQISSVHNFLISIGLPMYQKSLSEAGIGTLEQLLKVKESDLEQMTGADSRHLRRIAHALEWVQHKLASPSHKARATGVTDKV